MRIGAVLGTALAAWLMLQAGMLAAQDVRTYTIVSWEDPQAARAVAERGTVVFDAAFVAAHQGLTWTDPFVDSRTTLQFFGMVWHSPHGRVSIDPHPTEGVEIVGPDDLTLENVQAIVRELDATANVDQVREGERDNSWYTSNMDVTAFLDARGGALAADWVYEPLGFLFVLVSNGETMVWDDAELHGVTQFASLDVGDATITSDGGRRLSLVVPGILDWNQGHAIVARALADGDLGAPPVAVALSIQITE